MITKVKTLDEILSYQAMYEKVCVKVGTPHCGACNVVEGNMMEVSKHHDDACFIIVDAEECEDVILDHFEIRSIPTVVFIKDGTVLSKKTGVTTQQDFNAFLRA